MGPAPSRSESKLDSRYRLGGLQSLAAARSEHCPIGFVAAEGPGALRINARNSVAYSSFAFRPPFGVSVLPKLWDRCFSA